MNYEEWKKKNNFSSFGTQSTEQISNPLLKSYPSQFALSKLDTPGEPREEDDAYENFMGIDPNQNALYDFVGNAVWGLGEAFMVPTVADIASGGELSKQFGSDDWVDESLAGKVGYAVGTGVGILTGIGAVGKTLSFGSRLAGAGTKQATKQVAKTGAKLGISDDAAKALVSNTRNLIDESIKDGVKALGPSRFVKWSGANFTAKSIKHMPLNDMAIKTRVASEVAEGIAKTTGKEISDDAVIKMTNEVMELSAKSRTKHFGNSIGYTLKQRGWNPKVAQIAGDMVYESVLLATWDTMAGEIADQYAEWKELGEDEWGYDAWYSRAMHGAVLGAALAPARYWGQFGGGTRGKQVAFGQSGMVADAKNVIRMLAYTLKRPATSKGKALMSDHSLVGAINNIVTTAGHTAVGKEGKHIPGFTKAWLEKVTKDLVNKSAVSNKDRQLLDTIWNSMRSDLPRLSKKLMGEIVRDGKESFTRASIGSLIMNGSAYKDAYERGILFTDEYPWDKMIFDHIVGMAYMKRGKTFEGNPSMPRYFDSMKMPANGSELARTMNTLDVLGKSSKDLHNLNSLYAGHVPHDIENVVNNRAINNDAGIRELVEKVRKDVVPVEEFVQEISNNKELSHWREHVEKEISERYTRIQELERKNTESSKREAKDLKEETIDLQNAIIVATEMQSIALFGQSGEAIRAMDRLTAVEYAKSFINIKLSDGTKITSQNYDIMHEKLDRARFEVSANIENLLITHIQESLNALGLVGFHEGGYDAKNGKTIIHKSVKEGLESLRQYSPDGGKTRPYEEASNALLEAIDNANYAGVIKLGDAGVKYESQDLINRDNLNKFLEHYNRNTDTLHELVFNPEGNTHETSWMERVPGQVGKKGFADPNIIGSTPIWDGIQSAHRYRRNELTYDGFMGKGDMTFHHDIKGKLNGNIGFKVVSEIKEADGSITKVPAELTPELQFFLNSLNSTNKMLDTKGIAGMQEITLSELKTLQETTFNNFGNVLQDPAEFVTFNNYLYKKLVSDVTGNKNVSTNLRKVIQLGLDPDNPLTFKVGGRVQFASAKALRDALLGDKNISEAQRKSLDKLINEYEVKVQRPVQEQIKSTGILTFSDNLKPNTRARDIGELKQMLQEMVFKADVFSVSEVTEQYRLINDTSKGINDLIAKNTSVNTDKKVRDEVSIAIKELAESNQNLTTLLQTYISNNDVLGIRYLLDTRQKLDHLNRDIFTNNASDPKVILEYKRLLDGYVTEALNERNSRLNIETLEGVDAHLEKRIGNVGLSDRSGNVRKFRNDTKISSQRYETKWGFSDGFVRDLVANPKKVFEILDMQMNKKHNNIYDKGLAGIDTKSFTIENFVDIVVDPLLKTMEKKIEFAKKNDSSDNYPGSYNEFVMETFQVIQSNLGTKNIPIGIYENGRLNIKEASVSNWDVGINRLATSLNLEAPGSIILMGKTIGTRNGFTSNITKEMKFQMFADLESGVPVNINSREVLASGDAKLLEHYKNIMVGQGKHATQEFIPIQLDQGTLILIPNIAKKSIKYAWESREGSLREKLSFIIEKQLNLSPKEAKKKAEEYLESLTGNTFDKDSGFMGGSLDNNGLQSLVMTTRLMEAFPHLMGDVVNNKMTLKESLSVLKYIKMDSPRGGTALNERALNFTREFIPRYIGEKSTLDQAFNIFNNHFFDSSGKPTKHRTINVFDESGTGKGFFDSSGIGRMQLKEQMKANNPKLSDAEINKRVDEQMALYDPIAASATNGEKYLSLPEMTSMLVSLGASNDWFVKDTKGKIVGFNVALKPIEFHSKVDSKSGAIEVHVGKTAYKFNPLMDNLMKNTRGEYILDSIGFESTHKVHSKYSESDKKMITPGISMGDNPSKNFLSDMRMPSDIKNEIMEIDRGSIFIKSVSGKHEGTLSSGFGNLMSNDALAALNSLTNVKSVTYDLQNRLANLAKNPFAYQPIAQQLLHFQKSVGDNIGQITGIESILAAKGLPVFEHMMPNIDRMVTSEFMGSRNMVSSSVSKGSYSVMTAGEGYTLPERRGNIQYKFGGSGMSHTEWSRDLTDIFLLKDVRGQSNKDVINISSNEGLSFVFKATKEMVDLLPKGMLEIGHDIAVTHDGYVMGPHKNFKFQKADLTKFDNFMLEKYNEILTEAANTPEVRTVGDLAIYLGGKGKFLAKQQGFGDNLVTDPNQQVHLAKIDLRQPKPGLNDWVITRVEKLIDQRRGPVSEMNLMDVINPQDADFDLDKSASFFALPGKVINEVYNVSGYGQSTEVLWNRIKEQVRVESHNDISNYADVMNHIEKKRSSVLRQGSILSGLAQYFSTRPGYERDIFVPGETKLDNRKSIQLGDTKRGYEIITMTDPISRNEYTIQLRDGYELAGSVGYMKKIVKSTIDIYKETQQIPDVEHLLWEHPDIGFLKVTGKKGYSEQGIPIDQLPESVQRMFNNIKQNILKPMGDLYNLGLMTENFGDGTSRKMSAFEATYKYEQILGRIKFAGLDQKFNADGFSIGFKPNQLNLFVQNLSKFLGDNPYKNNTAGTSENPLIIALSNLRKSQNKFFSGIPAESDLGTMLLGRQLGKEQLSKAISSIIADQNKMVQITSSVQSLEHINDVLNSLQYSNKLNTSTGRYWQKQKQIHETIVNEFTLQLNDPAVVFNAMETRKQPKPGSRKAEDHYAIYRKVGKEGEVKVVDRIEPGQTMKWRKGDVLFKNPKRIEAGNENISKIRHAMHDAFARKDRALSSNEYQIIDKLVKDFMNDVNNIDIVDKNAPRTAERAGTLAEAELAVLADYLQQAGGLASHKGEIMQKNFLYRLLTPSVRDGVFDYIGKDPASNNSRLTVHFNSNVKNERMVFKLLQRAMQKKAETVMSSDVAKEWYQEINDRFKVSILKQWDPTLIQRDIFNYDRISRGPADFRLTVPSENLPRFVFETNLNKVSKDILQSYVNGTYFLDPIEVYRMTLGLDKGALGQMPHMSHISERIKHLWEGTENIKYGPKQEWYKPLHTFRSKSHHNIDRTKKPTALETARQIERTCF